MGDQIEKNAMGVSCSTYGEIGGVYRVFVGNPEGKATSKTQAYMGI
jgi:hypothetical protein